jgi:hypothetical protein
LRLNRIDLPCQANLALLKNGSNRKIYPQYQIVGLPHLDKAKDKITVSPDNDLYGL